jgi:hypothetical protein
LRRTGPPPTIPTVRTTDRLQRMAFDQLDAAAGVCVRVSPLGFAVQPRRARLRRLPATLGERVAGATPVVVRKASDQIGFAVQPRPWVVERFFAWIGRRDWQSRLQRAACTMPPGPGSVL